MKGKRIKIKRPSRAAAKAKPRPTTTTYWPTLLMLPSVRWGWVES